MWDGAKPCREEGTRPWGSWAALWGREGRAEPVLGAVLCHRGGLDGHLYGEFWVVETGRAAAGEFPLTHDSGHPGPQQRGAESQPSEDTGQPPAPSSPAAAPFPDTNTVIIVRDTEKHVS